MTTLPTITEPTTAKYAGREVTKDQLDELLRIRRSARAAHAAVQAERQAQVSAILQAVPAVGASDADRRRAGKALRDTRIRGSWDAVAIEDRAIAQTCSVLGVPGFFERRYWGAPGTNDDPIVRIRAEFGLEQIGDDMWASLFIKDLDAYATVHGLDPVVAKAHAQRNAVMWGREHIRREAQLARSAHGTAALKHRGLERFARMPNPNACAYCLLVSTRTYYVSNLQPAHPDCDCAVGPVREHSAPASLEGPSEPLKTPSGIVLGGVAANALRALTAVPEPTSVLAAQTLMAAANRPEVARTLTLALPPEIEHSPGYGPMIIPQQLSGAEAEAALAAVDELSAA